MTGEANLGTGLRRTGCAALGLLAMLALAPIFAPRVAVAAGPYEPNDSVLSAAGPLLAGQTYAAGLETPGDRDFFYFYVTSTRPSQVALTLRNLGGGTPSSGVNAAIVDSLANPIDAFAYAIGNGGEASGTIALKPQKYFVEVDSIEGSAGGISYSLAPGGGRGAFGPYAQIAARCKAATAAARRAQTRLRRAEGKQQRALAAFQGSLYSGRRAHRAARRAYRKANARVAARRRALRRAKRSQRPWCFIPQ
jgi:hypothetical protein